MYAGMIGFCPRGVLDFLQASNIFIVLKFRNIPSPSQVLTTSIEKIPDFKQMGMQ